jgi:hypothetical protein
LSDQVSSPAGGFSAMKSAADLRDKLRRDYARLAAHPGDADLAFNFFVTADHMVDWLYPDDPGRRTEAREVPLLAVCAQLANGTKHFRVTDRRHRSASGARRTVGYFANYMGTYFGWYFGGGRLAVDLQGVAADTFGPQVGAGDLARAVLAYWDKHPELG